MPLMSATAERAVLSSPNARATWLSTWKSNERSVDTSTPRYLTTALTVNVCLLPAAAVASCGGGGVHRHATCVPSVAPQPGPAQRSSHFFIESR
jgi:hypothetical protein